MVMCKEPAMRAPRSGCSAANSCRMAMSPGISVSAMRISLRPQSAKARSLTKYSDFILTAAFIEGSFKGLGRTRGFELGRERVRFVGPLPRELLFLAAEMTVRGGFLINRPCEIEHLAQPERR